MTGTHPSPDVSQRLQDWLATPEAYPHAPATVERIETHISVVYLAGSLVYKLKKPVKLDFLDFTTLQQREEACRDELRLNARLAPGMYLGVVPVTRDAGNRFTLNGHGETIDWLVEMRRMPTERSLLNLHRQGKLLPSHLQQLAQVLARFYRQQQPLSVPADDYLRSYTAHVSDNRSTLLRLAEPAEHLRVKRVHGMQLQLLKCHPELLVNRIVTQRIYDGHGDLRPEHILLADQISIFDCLEFSADLRRIDAADELAFLAAECDFIGASWVEPLLYTEYSHQTGDHPSRVLIDFYKSYRAAVRAKVAAIRASQLTGTLHQQAMAEMSAHLRLADHYCAPYQKPLLLMVGGLSGTGKSTLATAVADALGAELLRSDLVRRELYPAGATEAYLPASRQRVYDVLFERADELRRQRVPAVIDATFATRHSVEQFRQFQERLPSRTLFVECWCAPAIAKERIAKRQRAGQDASDATVDVYHAQQQNWEAWPSDLPVCRVDTEQPLSFQMQQLFAALAAR